MSDRSYNLSAIDRALISTALRWYARELRLTAADLMVNETIQARRADARHCDELANSFGGR